MGENRPNLYRAVRPVKQVRAGRRHNLQVERSPGYLPARLATETMRIAFLFDIHANLPALRAVLHVLQSEGWDALCHGGDLVGWGPQPNEVVALIAERAISGVVGNHELLCLGAFTEDHPLRNESTRWTAEQLSPEAHAFLGALPPRLARDEFLLSHANPSAWHDPPDAECFPYLHSAEPLAGQPELFREAPGGLIVTGHVHEAAVYLAHLGGLALERRSLAPSDARLDVAVPSGCSAFVVAGAVGKPRDGVPAANYLVLDTGSRTISLRRVSYDVDAACASLRQTALPAVLAEELGNGR